MTPGCVLQTVKLARQLQALAVRGNWDENYLALADGRQTKAVCPCGICLDLLSLSHQCMSASAACWMFYPSSKGITKEMR